MLPKKNSRLTLRQHKEYFLYHPTVTFDNVTDRSWSREHDLYFHNNNKQKIPCYSRSFDNLMYGWSLVHKFTFQINIMKQVWKQTIDTSMMPKCMLLFIMMKTITQGIQHNWYNEYKKQHHTARHEVGTRASTAPYTTKTTQFELLKSSTSSNVFVHKH